MPILLLIVFIFQLSAVADMPTLNAYATQVELAEQRAHSSNCITLQIDVHAKEKDAVFGQTFFYASLDERNSPPAEQEKISSLSFERLLFYSVGDSFLEPMRMNLIAIIPIPPLRESKILDIEPLPS